MGGCLKRGLKMQEAIKGQALRARMRKPHKPSPKTATQDRQPKPVAGQGA